MILVLISALLPIIVTLCLGYFSGARKDFGESHSKILNKLIMSYGLPMSLFGGILATGRKVIFENIPVAIWIFIGMVGGYLIVFSICKFILKNSTSLSALRSLTISGPAIPFVGPTLLGFLFPTETSLIVAIGSLIMNVVQVPLTVILLSTDSYELSASNKNRKINSLGLDIISAFKKPVVWAPIFALILSLFGITLSPIWQKNFSVLGGATGGMALFSIGIILYVKKPKLNLAVWMNTLSRTVFVPLVIFLVMMFFKVDRSVINMTTMTMGITIAAISTIFANQYKVAEQEMASTLFLSNIISIFSMGLIIVFLKI